MFPRFSGVVILKSVDFPRFLGVLVVVAGGGYLADTFARILVPDFEFTFSLITFVGEALLIFWLLWRAIKGFPSETESKAGHAGRDSDDGACLKPEEFHSSGPARSGGPRSWRRTGRE